MNVLRRIMFALIQTLLPIILCFLLFLTGSFTAENFPIELVAMYIVSSVLHLVHKCSIFVHSPYMIANCLRVL